MQHEVYKMKARGIDVIFCWIPGHVDIEENERADALAKLATTRTPRYFPIYYVECGRIVKENLESNGIRGRKEVGKSCWRLKGNLAGIRETRKEEVLINRLRAGHT